MTAGTPPGEGRISLRDAVAAAVWWTWRVLLLAVAAYLVVRVAQRLSVVTVPLALALLLTAALVPVRDLVERTGLPRVASALISFVAALLALFGLLFLLGTRVSADAPRLVADAQDAVDGLQRIAQHGIAGIGAEQVSMLRDRVTAWLQTGNSDLVGTVLTGLDMTVRATVAAVLTAVLTFLLLWDGERIWSVLNRARTSGWSRRIDHAGRAAWHSLSGYLRGTLTIATIHGVVVGTTLVVLGVPLAAVLAVGVFLGSFVPLVGALVAGGLAVLVTLGTQGFVSAAIVLAVLVASNQAEAHLLQPLVMHRFVHLHPIVIVLAITAFSAVWGVVGALLAVPTCAVVARAAPILFGTGSVQEEEDEPREGEDADTDDAGAGTDARCRTGDPGAGTDGEGRSGAGSRTTS